MENKLEKERLFHNKRFGGDDNERIDANKYYAIDKFLNNYYFDKIKEKCNGADLLDYGCGIGITALKWAIQGANVTGIDISDEGIKKAIELAKTKSIKIKFYQMDAQNMEQFQDNTFDIITGRAILHHLDLNKSFSELARVLRKDGRAVFVEPLGHNPIINLYRLLTPSMRTEDEHPLTINDIKNATRYFGEIITTHFHFFTLLAVPFRSYFFFHPILSIMHTIDRTMMRIFPFLRRYSWTVVLEFYKPLK